MSECPVCGAAVNVYRDEARELRARLAAVEALCDQFVAGDLTLWNLADQVRAAVRGEGNQPAEIKCWESTDCSGCDDTVCRPAIGGEADRPAEDCEHRYPANMPDEVIAWRCALCGEVQRVAKHWSDLRGEGDRG